MFALTSKVLSSGVRRAPLAALLALGMSTVVNAEVFFQEDFEKGSISTAAQPKWSWPSAGTESNPENGMMFGAADMYSVSDAASYSGRYSLRLNYAGRNNWCNQCGTTSVTLTQSNIDSGCVSVSGGQWGNSVFNKSNGFSRWPVTSVTSSQVCFNKSSPLGSSIYGANGWNVGDELKVPYLCGTNGIVGGDASRRSDCDKAINYLDGVSSADLGYGKSISRRFYLYIPSDTVLPGTTQKLGYMHARVNGSVQAYTLKLSVQRGLTLELTAPGDKVADLSVKVERDKWFYIEEVFTRESSSSASDGKYVLYLNAADLGAQAPVVVQNNVQIGEMVDMSFNGNFQHNNDAKGYIYFDEILISSGYAGPVDGDAVARPAAPSNLGITVTQ